MPESTSPIPQKRPEDPPEVAEELTQAAASWDGGDRAEALAALRRATSAAYRLHAGRRISELAKAVAELLKAMAAAGAPSGSTKAANGPAPVVRAAAPPGPAPPKPPPKPAPVTDTTPTSDASEDIPISFGDLDEAVDPFPSVAPIAAPVAVAQPSPAGSTEVAAAAPPPSPVASTSATTSATTSASMPAAPAAPAEKASRASSRPSKRRSSPPKGDKGAPPVALAIAAAAPAAGEAPAAATNDVVIASVDSEPSGDRLTSPGDVSSAPPSDGASTSEGETPRPSPSSPPPTQNFEEKAETPAAKSSARKSAAGSAPPSLADLEGVAALASLDVAARTKLLGAARALVIAKGERVAAPASIVVVRGAIEVRAKGREVAIDRLATGDVRKLSTTSSPAADELVLSAVDDGVRCLALPTGALDALATSAPEVHATLERRRDETTAFAAVLRDRPIGSLSDALLIALRERSEVRRLPEGTIVVRASEAVRALVVVAGGALSLHLGETQPEIARIGPGEVLFPRELVRETPSPREVRVPAGGALVLAARRAATKALLAENAHLRKALETWGADDPLQDPLEW